MTRIRAGIADQLSARRYRRRSNIVQHHLRTLAEQEAHWRNDEDFARLRMMATELERITQAMESEVR